MAVIDIERVTTSPTLFLATTSTILFVAYVLVHTFFLRRLPPNAPPAVSGNFPLTGATGFWSRRWDFYRRARAHASTGNFSFHAGPNTIVGLSGEKGRRLFFESKELGFAEG